MNYTESYHLPQWEKSDRILMDDFNQAMSDIEDGLAAAVSHGDAAASQAESNATAAANAAQATANSALSAANAAQTSANQAYRPGHAPYAAGTYTGNGGTLDVTLGFQPSFLIISRQMAGSIDAGGTIAITGAADTLSTVQRTGTGFRVIYDSSRSVPYVNMGGTLYSFIAFR